MQGRETAGRLGSPLYLVSFNHAEMSVIDTALRASEIMRSPVDPADSWDTGVMVHRTEDRTYMAIRRERAAEFLSGIADTLCGYQAILRSRSGDITVAKTSDTDLSILLGRHVEAATYLALVLDLAVHAIHDAEGRKSKSQGNNPAELATI